jgi:uncharacterized protein
MSGWADWPPTKMPRHSQPRPRRPAAPGARRYFLALALVLLVSVVCRSWLGYYVDDLWFGSLGYGRVFWKTLRLESAVFSLFAIATFLILYGSFRALEWLHLAGLPRSQTIFFGTRPVTFPVAPVLHVLAATASLLIAIVSGAAMAANWTTFALYWYAPLTSVQAADPIFAKPLSFYLFVLPAWQLILGWLLLLSIIVCGAAILFRLSEKAGQSIKGQSEIYSPVSWSGFSIGFAFLLLFLAFQVYLSRFQQLLADHTTFDGITYTDAHIMVPGLFIVSAALLLGVGIALANAISLRRGRWLALAVLPALLCYVVLQGVGWYVQGFIVKPNELVRERPFILHNIKATRQAFGLDRVTRHEFPADAGIAALDLQQNEVTLQNIRLWDWTALQDTLRQIQEIRTYYDFPDVDIDRYQIDGRPREVMLATRELNINKLPGSSRNWINEKLIYTHGYGTTMNAVNGFTEEGLPKLYLSNMPVESSIPDLKVSRPEIYFGELTNTDVYVKTRQNEFNYPQGETNSFTSYQGDGGIVLGGLVRRILLAIDRGDVGKLPFSDDVNSQSQLLMRRNVQSRVSALTPFLTFDSDPYIVIGQDGRLYWMMDGFTTSDAYPYASRYQLDGTPVNYIRNSVKAVIDAYDGRTTFYVFDPEDPIIAGYRRIFPELFQDASAMPAGLRQHVRYPELLLGLQAEVYGLYHMTDPQMFYNREDLWNVASEVSLSRRGEQTTQSMQPNFVLMKLPGETELEFVEILPFTPSNRNNMIGWIAGRSDGVHYGSAVVFDFPKTKLVDGPLQVEARIDQNAQLSGQLSLWNQQGSHVRRGSMLVIPCGRGILYAEPIYLQAERSPMPELRLVVLALQDRLAYGPTFDAAMASLFGSQEPGGTASIQPSKANGAAGASKDELDKLITEAAHDLSEYQRLTSEGKLGEAGQKLEQLKAALDALHSRQNNSH